MKIAWVHRFDKDIPGGGIFMFQLAETYENSDIEIKLIYIEKINLWNFWSVLGNLKTQAADCDIIHAQYGSGTGFLASRLNGVKILTLRGSDWYRYTGNFRQWLKGKVIWMLTRVSLKKYSCIISVSDSMRDGILNRGVKIPVRVVPSGINLKYFRPYPIGEALRKLGVKKKKGEKWVLFSSVSDKNPVKRYDLAMQTMAELKKKDDSFVLKYMHGLDHSDVVYFLNSCDVILLTSTHEGWPNIIKEGLACNIPFVSTDVSDLRKIAEKTQSCFVCEPDPIELSEAIVKSVNIKKELNEILREYVGFMDINLISEKLKKIYKSFV